MLRIFVLIAVMLLNFCVMAAEGGGGSDNAEGKESSSQKSEFTVEPGSSDDELILTLQDKTKLHIKLIKDDNLPDCQKGVCTYEVPKVEAAVAAPKALRYTPSTEKPKSPKKISLVQCKQLLTKFKKNLISYILNGKSTAPQVLASARAVNNAFGVSFIDEETLVAIMLFHQIGINWPEFKKRASRLRNMRFINLPPEEQKMVNAFYDRVVFTKFEGGNRTAFEQFGALRYVIAGADFGVACANCNFTGGCASCAATWTREYWTRQDLVQENSSWVILKTHLDTVLVQKPCDVCGFKHIRCTVCKGVGKALVTKKTTQYYISEMLKILRLDFNTAWRNYAEAMSAYENSPKDKKALAAARKKLRAAASGKQALPQAMYAYAQFLEKGIGGAKNPRLASTYYLRAADKGIVEAMIREVNKIYALKRYNDAKPWLLKLEPYRIPDVLKDIAWLEENGAGLLNGEKKPGKFVYPYYKKAADLGSKEAFSWCEKYNAAREPSPWVNLRYGLPNSWRNKSVYCRACFTTGLRQMNIMGKRFNVHCAACEGRGSTLMPVNARDKTDEFSKVPYRYIRIAKGWYHYHGLSSGANELAAETTKHMLCPICDGKSYFVKPDGWYADCDYCNDDDGICSFKILKREEPPKPENNEGSSADTPPADAAANPSATDAPPADAPPADAPPAV